MLSPDPVALLRRHFGYPSFRPGQEDLVRAVLEGRDALGVLPTGGGKSVCYQVPALARPGLTLVITPLVSLMEDQAARASHAHLRGAYVSATRSAPERRRTMEAARAGALDILFVAPERLEVPGFLESLEGVAVTLIAVDEAHCISEWGHDFRPAYLRLARVRSVVEAPMLALTATATPRVRREIRASLALRDPLEVVHSFDRGNLTWSVRHGGDHGDRIAALARALHHARGSGIVYAPTRRTVEAVRDGLAGQGMRIEAYHAGLPGLERTRVQEEFLSGRCRWVVATNAFGMGIDKADVRVVAHYQLPATLEAYYQEAGRAGRDGAPALCVAFHATRDARLQRRFLDRARPDRRTLRRLHRTLLRGVGAGREAWVDLDRLRREARIRDSGALQGALEALARAGGVRVLGPAPGTEPRSRSASPLSGTPGGASGSLRARVGVRAAVDLSEALLLRQAALSKLSAVREYAQGRRCRRRALLAYFGEEAPPRCGGCDRCLRRPAE